MIPSLDTVWATLVSSPEIHHRYVGRWAQDGDGIDMRAARTVAARGRYKMHLPAEHVLVEPQIMCRCDYSVYESAEPRATVAWTLERAVVAYGVGAWFESVLAPNVELSNRPGAPDVLYGQAYFPWAEPVSLAEGEKVEIELVARHDGHGYHLAVARV